MVEKLDRTSIAVRHDDLHALAREMGFSMEQMFDFLRCQRLSFWNDELLEALPGEQHLWFIPAQEPGR